MFSALKKGCENEFVAFAEEEGVGSKRCSKAGRQEGRRKSRWPAMDCKEVKSLEGNPRRGGSDVGRRCDRFLVASKVEASAWPARLGSACSRSRITAATRGTVIGLHARPKKEGQRGEMR